MLRIPTIFFCLLITIITNAQIDNQLEAHYKFDGNFNDELGGSDFINYSDSVHYFTNDFFGNNRKALKIIDSTYFGAGFVNQVACTERYSITLNFKLMGAGSVTNFNGSVPIVLIKKDVSEYFERLLFYYNNGKLGVKWCDRDNSVKLSTTINFNYNQWYHAALVVDETSFKFYIDGVLIDIITKSLPLSCDPSNFVHIGNFKFPTRQGKMNGAIDDIRLYSRALHEEEITKILEADQNEITVEPEDNTASISEVNNSKILVYPNPTNSNLTFESDFLVEKYHSIEIIDCSGRVLNVEKIMGNQIVLSVSDLSTGIYFAKLNGVDNKVIKFEVIK